MDDTPTQYSFLEVGPVFYGALATNLFYAHVCVVLFIQPFQKRLS